MSIEDEAKRYVDKRREDFVSALDTAIEAVELHLRRHLYDTADREQAVLKLQEASMWAKRCWDTYGRTRH